MVPKKLSSNWPHEKLQELNPLSHPPNTANHKIKSQLFPPTNLLPRVPLRFSTPPTSNQSKSQQFYKHHKPKMLKEERNHLLEIDINKLAHPCDTCHLAACVVYCRADSAYLCAECDATIHSANPLARRHHRVPIGEPILDAGHNHESLFDTMSEEDEDETASWLFLDPVKGNNANESKDGVVFSTLDEYLGLDNQFTDQYSNPPQQFSTYPFKVYGSDSVVPFQNEMKSKIPHQHHNYRFGSENGTSKDGYYNPASISHSVSVSSMDTGIVPESTTSDVSVSNPRSSKGTIDLFASPPVQIPTQLSPMDREARVLRYREKKKMRKFEKTIRYASRKAYAETRPRIKGRFAKRTDVEDEVDQMFATSVFAEGGYGIVPSY